MLLIQSQKLEGVSVNVDKCKASTSGFYNHLQWLFVTATYRISQTTWVTNNWKVNSRDFRFNNWSRITTNIARKIIPTMNCNNKIWPFQALEKAWKNIAVVISSQNFVLVLNHDNLEISTLFSWQIRNFFSSKLWLFLYIRLITDLVD